MLGLHLLSPLLVIHRELSSPCPFGFAPRCAPAAMEGSSTGERQPGHSVPYVHSSLLPQHQLSLLPLFCFFVFFFFSPEICAPSFRVELWVIVRSGVLCPGTRGGSPMSTEQLCWL